MSFQVREFDYEAKDHQFQWKFKLGNLSTSQLDFYSQETSSRSLLHLSEDLSAQIQQAMEKKNKKAECKERTIRKLTEKMVKGLKIKLSTFASDLQEEKASVIAFFMKTELKQHIRERIIHKCKQWIISTWVHFTRGFSSFSNLQLAKELLNRYYQLYSIIFQLSLPPRDFYLITDKYLKSYIQDGKRISPDFEVLNEIYAIALEDEVQHTQEQDPAANELILVDINLNVQDKYISQSLLWNPQNISNIKIKSFITHFLNDILAENRITVEKEMFKDLQKEARIQLRTQLLYKSLLKKHAYILLNFSTIQIPAQVKEYLITIELRINADNGQLIFQDRFQWDILNELNDVQKFVASLIQDADLPQKYFSQICYKMRTQINNQLQWKFGLLVKTFKAIHKDRQSPKLNTQTISVLRKNITFTMDVTLPCSDESYKPNQDIYFNNSDLFSLLSRNIDLLPQQFQQILMCKESKNQEKEPSKITKQIAQDYLSKNNISIDSNPYLANVSSHYNLHTIWRKSLSK